MSKVVRVERQRRLDQLVARQQREIDLEGLQRHVDLERLVVIALVAFGDLRIDIDLVAANCRCPTSRS